MHFTLSKQDILTEIFPKYTLISNSFAGSKAECRAIITGDINRNDS